MAVTIASIPGLSNEPQKIGQMKARFVDITPDNSYPTGGWALTPGQVGMAKILAVIVPNSNGYAMTYVRSTGKLLVRATGSANQAAFAEIPNATDLSALTIFAIVFGY